MRLVAVAGIAACIAAGSAHLGTRADPAAPPVARHLPVQPRERIGLTLVLRTHEHALKRYLARRQGSPAESPRPLSAAELGRRFGPSLETIRRVERQLRRAGFEVVRVPAQRTSIEVSGTAATVERYFDVRLFVERHADAAYRVPTGRPTVPRVIRRRISDVVGLDTRPHVHPAEVGSGFLLGGLRPVDALRAYDADPLHRRGVLGRGVTVGILSFASFDRNLVDGYSRFFHLPRALPKIVDVDRGNIPKWDYEADLDVDVVHATAPHARLILYRAPNTRKAYLDMLDRIIDGPAQIVSDSWGLCALKESLKRDIETRLEEARAAGKTFFAASGDEGAYDCQEFAFGDHRLSVDFPAASPSVVAVGGTLLDVRRDGSYFRESGWEEPLSYGGGGGGVDRTYARPPWQLLVGGGRRTRRMVPDVAAAANPLSGWWVRSRDCRDCFVSWGGTSAATPFWAGSWALVLQYAARRGAGRLGFAAPLLYTVWARENQLRPFHDVVRGGNRYWPATPGFDLATGLGSPDVWNLSRAVARLACSKRRCGG